MQSGDQRLVCCFAALLAFAAPAMGAVDADFEATVHVADETELFFAISAHYFDEDLRTVERYAARYRDPDDLAVALFIGRHSGRSAEQVYALHGRGLSWWELSLEVGLPVDVWFVEVNREPGPPYGKAYSYWRRHQADRSQIVVLNDAEIQHLVAAKMIHEYYDIPADRAMEWRASGQNLRYLMAQEYRRRHAAPSEPTKHRGNGTSKQSH